MYISCLTPDSKASFWPANCNTYMVSSAEGGLTSMGKILFHFLQCNNIVEICTKVFIKVPSLNFLLYMNKLSMVFWMKGPNFSPNLIRAHVKPSYRTHSDWGVSQKLRHCLQLEDPLLRGVFRWLKRFYSACCWSPLSVKLLRSTLFSSNTMH